MQIIWGQCYYMQVWNISSIIYVDFSNNTGWSYLWINLNITWNMNVSIVDFLLSIHQNHWNEKEFSEVRKVLITTKLTLKTDNNMNHEVNILSVIDKIKLYSHGRDQLIKLWRLGEQEFVIQSTEQLFAFGLVFGVGGSAGTQTEWQLFMDVPILSPLYIYLPSQRTGPCTLGL